MHDIIFALRHLSKARAFTVVAVLTLALGIGASAALFSVVHGVLIAPYPYAKPNEIWAPRVSDLKTGESSALRISDFLAIAAHPSVAQAMATAHDQVRLRGDSTPEVINAPRVSGTGFDFLGVRPLLGRGIGRGDIRANGEVEAVVVLSFRLWQRLFNGDPEAIGRTMVLNDEPHVIIGVMPPRFGWYSGDGVWLPLAITDVGRRVDPVVRLDRVVKEVAEEQLLGLFQQLAKETPERFSKEGLTVTLSNLLDDTVASRGVGGMKSSLHMLLYAVGSLLVIACTNVANLQLARGMARSREFAVRLALGASRLRLVRQLLVESVCLALAGGVLGVIFAFGFTKMIVALLPPSGVPIEARVTMNGWVLGLSTAISVVSGILFGIAPALQSTRPNLNEALKDGGHVGGVNVSVRGRRMRSVFVVVEIALSIILLASASLAIGRFVELSHLDPGYPPDRLLTLRVPLPAQRYATSEQRNAFARELLERMRNLPGVVTAAVGVPPHFEGTSTYTIRGQPAENRREVALGLVSAEYPSTLGIAIRGGRDFSPDEVARGEHVALISQAAAKLWPTGEDPIGRTIELGALLTPASLNNPAQAGVGMEVTIVGIVGDVRNYATADPRSVPQPVVFVPYTLRSPAQRAFILRTHGDPMGVLNTLRAAVHALDKELPIARPLTVTEIVGFHTVGPRFNMALFGGLAGIALALAAAGIYSVLSYQVSQRTREIGVRMALGAARADILWLILGAGSRLIVIGVSVGLALSIVVASLLKSQVFAVPNLDPVALTAACCTLSFVGLVACYIPARRASTIDPMVALRDG